ncbi:MAG: hypothetical protein PSV43_01890 [Prosthecobacter sp.]|nr:hypothetical protein [Prosthecobacter sp.]MDI1310876.1 hypothetical protein [Prosthecobacter sp.]
MIDTELRLIAASAMIGLSSSPKNGVKHTGGDADAEDIVEEGEDEILPYG